MWWRAAATEVTHHLHRYHQRRTHPTQPSWRHEVWWAAVVGVHKMRLANWIDTSKGERGSVPEVTLLTIRIIKTAITIAAAAANN